MQGRTPRILDISLQRLTPSGLVQGHDVVEHMAVFWVAPLSGALLAGLFWSVLTRSPAKKRPQGAKFHPKKNSAEAKKDD